MQDTPTLQPFRSSHGRSRLSDDLGMVAGAGLRMLALAAGANVVCEELTGKERWSGRRLTACYIGSGENLRYLSSLLFQGEVARGSRATYPWWSGRRRMREAAGTADLVVSDLDCPLHYFSGRAPMLSIPRWLKQTIPVSARTWDDLLRSLRRKTRKEALRVFRNSDLELDLVDGRSAAADFYRRLYRPSVRERFGEEGVIVDEHTFVTECAKGKIARVTHRQRWLAGVLLQFRKPRLLVRWYGSDASLALTERKGLSDALDLYTLKLAIDHGIDIVDMGHSRPRLNDGVLRYKCKWGARIGQGRMPKGRFLITARTMSDVVTSALAHNPFVLQERRQLISRLLLPGEWSSMAAIEKEIARRIVPGLGRVKAFLTGAVPVASGDGLITVDDVPVELVSLAGATDPIRLFMNG